MNMYCPYCGSENIDTCGRCTNCGQFFNYVNLSKSSITSYDTTVQYPYQFMGRSQSRRLYVNRPAESV